MQRWRDEGRRKHEQALKDIAESDMIRTPGEAPVALERQINNMRIAMNHRLARTVEAFDREFGVRRA